MANNKAKEAVKIIGETISKLSLATQKLGLSVRNLTYDESRADNVKIDIGYIRWISQFVSERSDCVLENTCGRDGLNQRSEDDLSEKLSYDTYAKAAATKKHLRELSNAIHKAEVNGENGVEWLKKNTNIIDVIKGKVQRPWTPDPANIGQILREWRGDKYSLYAIAKEQNCRADGLQRIEEGKGVTTINLMHYLHFIKTHDPESDVIAAIWAIL